MRIFVINPNASETMTDQIRVALNAVKRQDSKLFATCAAAGPETIESVCGEGQDGPSQKHAFRRSDQTR